MDATNYKFFKNLIELQKECDNYPNIFMFDLKNGETDETLYFKPFPLETNQVFSGIFAQTHEVALRFVDFLKNFKPAPGVDIELELDKARIGVLSILIEGSIDNPNTLHIYLTGFGIYNQDQSLIQSFYDHIEKFMDSGEIEISEMAGS